MLSLKKMKNGPSNEQIAFFFEQIAYYQIRLNLQDWRIENSGHFADKGNMADVGMSLPDKLAVVSIGRDFGVPVSNYLLTSTALHELLHVFLKPLIEAARSRDDSAIDSAEHSVVVLLEKLLHE